MKRGRAKAYAMRRRGRGVDTSKYVRKSVPSLHVLFDILICKLLLPYFIVFGVDFHYSSTKHLLIDYIPVSQMFCIIFLYGIIDFKNIPVRNWGSQMGKRTYAMVGVVA